MHPASRIANIVATNASGPSLASETYHVRPVPQTRAIIVIEGFEVPWYSWYSFLTLPMYDMLTPDSRSPGRPPDWETVVLPMLSVAGYLNRGIT
jgi:hypothetical protein